MSQASNSAAPTPKPAFTTDLLASVVVFLVALPLCMGIAIASGVPPALGLITGMVGGLVVGFLAGQPLQVSGPAAGLAVMVWQFVEDYGLAALGVGVLLAGALQLAAGFAKIGRWFRAVSPAVILGMLAGIGVLIFASQFHVMVDDKPRGTGLQNLVAIPEAIYKGISPSDGSTHHIAGAIGVSTIAAVLLWNRFKPERLKALPGPLIGVVLATAVAQLFALPIARVNVPSDFASSINWISAGSLSFLTDPRFLGAALGMAVIASAETLLCATAVDRMHDGERTDYDKELRAQGIGNMLCGVFGALPMTGVIVRSSANVEAGAKTKWSAILHGVWIAVLVLAFPQVLSWIPTASLAAILVYTGWKLLGIQAARRLAQRGRAEVVIWGATVAMIVATDLLTGVLTGFALAMGKLLLSFARLQVHVEAEDGIHHLEVSGAATFMSLPKLAEALESVPVDAVVHVHIDRLAYVDHACLELFDDWRLRHRGEVVMEMQHLAARTKLDFSTQPKARPAPRRKRRAEQTRSASQLPS